LAGPQGALLHNWRLKLSALGLSIFLWALVQTEPRTSETLSSVPVRIEVADTAWVLVGAPNPAMVELQLAGPAGEIIRLAREGTTLRVPLASVGSPDTLISVERDWVELGQWTGLTVEAVFPATIQLLLEPALTRVLPVARRVAGEIRGNLALASEVGVSPDVAQIRGPGSRLVGLDSLILEPFDLSAVRRSGNFIVAIDTTGLGGASIVPASITLGFNVEEAIERVFPGLPIQVDTERVGAEVVIDPVTIQVRFSGASSLVNALDPAFLRVWVAPEHLDGMLPGEERRVPLQVEGVPDLVAAVPATDVVTVRRIADGGPGGVR
jgi:YbbR domain-containing protein